MRSLTFTLLFSFLSFSLIAQTTWDDFESTRKADYSLATGVFIPYTGNPDPDVNTSTTVAAYERNAAEQFDVILIEAGMNGLESFIDGTNKFGMYVWAPAAGLPIQITLEDTSKATPGNFPTGRHSVYTTTTTKAMEWEFLEFNFVNQPDNSIGNDDPQRIVLLFEPGATGSSTAYYWDSLVGPNLDMDPCMGVTPDPNILNDFECNQNVAYTFSHAGINFRRIPNPDPSGINTSSHVATYTRNSGEEFDAIVGNFDGDLDLSQGNQIKLKVWDPNSPTRVVLALQRTGTPDNILVKELVDSTTVSNQWEELTFDASGLEDSTINRFVLLFEPGTFTSDNYFFDDFLLALGTNIEEYVEASSVEVFPNPATDKVLLSYKLKQSSTVQVDLIDINGKVVREYANGPQLSGDQQIELDVSGIASGMYFYRIYLGKESLAGKLIIRN